MAKYDTEDLKITGRFIEALKELIWAELEMMRAHDPETADCWTWGICEITDIAMTNGLSFQFGGEEDKPKDFPENTDVWIREG